jgi:hypothetical protein
MPRDAGKNGKPSNDEKLARIDPKTKKRVAVIRRAAAAAARTPRSA